MNRDEGLPRPVPHRHIQILTTSSLGGTPHSGRLFSKSAFMDTVHNISETLMQFENISQSTVCICQDPVDDKATYLDRKAWSQFLSMEFHFLLIFIIKTTNIFALRFSFLV
jgi:hypothetical protein